MRLRKTQILKFYELSEFSNVRFNLTSHGLNLIFSKLSHESLKWNSSLLDIRNSGVINYLLSIDLNTQRDLHEWIMIYLLLQKWTKV